MLVKVGDDLYVNADHVAVAELVSKKALPPPHLPPGSPNLIKRLPGKNVWCLVMANGLTMYVSQEGGDYLLVEAEARVGLATEEDKAKILEDEEIERRLDASLHGKKALDAGAF